MANFTGQKVGKQRKYQKKVPGVVDQDKGQGSDVTEPGNSGSVPSKDAAGGKKPIPKYKKKESLNPKKGTKDA